MQALKLALAKKPVLTPPLHVRALEAQRPLQLRGTVRSPSLTGLSISHSAQGSGEGAAWHPSPNPDPDQRSWETAEGRGCADGDLEIVCLRPSLSSAFLS